MKQQSKQNKLDAPWLEQMRQEMSDCTDFGTTLPADGWDKIAAQVNGPSIAPAPEKKRRRPLILWISTAASFLLLIGVGLRYLADTPGDAQQVPTEPAPLIVQMEEPEHTAEEQVPATEPMPIKVSEPKPIKVTRSSAPASQPLLAQAETKTESKIPAEALQETPTTMPMETLAAMPMETSEEKPSVEPSELSVPDEKEIQETLDSFEKQLKSDEDKVLMAMNDVEKPAVERAWHIGIAMDRGTGANADEVTETGNPQPRYESIISRRMTRAGNGGSTNNTTPQSSPGQKVYSSDHHRSFSMGISVSKALTQRLSIQSGLILTTLLSDITLCNKKQMEQRVQYIGIPLQLNVSLYENKHWQIYASGGGMFDQALKCRQGNNAINYDVQLWSVSTAAGVQYMFNRRIGLYLEPHLSYYFDNGTSAEVPTLFTEHPLTFNLQAGLKIRL